MEFGLLLDMILLALALADRINLMHDEKEQAQRYAIAQEHLAHRTLERAKADLERAVAERTTELARAKELAERLARTDSLTGLSNRRFFEERANQAFSRGKRYGHSLSLIVFDIDRFKQINDRFGHPAGDTVIKAVARLAEAGVREVDFVGRIGGEEFAVLLPDVDKRQAAVTAERLREILRSHEIPHGELRLKVTASFGVSDLGGEDREFEEILETEVLYTILGGNVVYQKEGP